MNGRMWVLALALGGCPGGGFIIDDFVDTAFFGDTDKEPPFGCFRALEVGYPTGDATGVHRGVAPEVRVANEVGAVTLRLRRDGEPQRGSNIAWRGSTTRLLAFLPREPLATSGSYTLEASTEDTEVLLAGGSIPLCQSEITIAFQTAAEGASALTSGSWWLAGEEESGAHAAVLHRLLPLLGDGYGLAPTLQITAQGPDSAEIRLGTVSRAFGLPDNEADPPDVLVGTWADRRLTATAEQVQIEDPVAPLVIRGLQLEVEQDGGGRLVGVRMAGEVDLSAWPADMLARACATADDRSIGCVRCEGAEDGERCLNLDARGMVGTAR